MKKILKYIEPVIFYGALLVDLGFIAKGGFNPSADGPSHVYNAQILKYLLSGNSFIHDFYTINWVPVPNVTGHIMLAMFSVVFPVNISLKLLLLICVAGFALGFRAIIVLLNPENTGLSAFVIPFAHSILYYLGFYNFCLSLVFMLWAIYFYLKWINPAGAEYNARKYIVMLLLITTTYFTNGLAFVILGGIILLFEIRGIQAIITSSAERPAVKVFKRLALFSSLWLPGITCFLIFILKVKTFDTNPYSKMSFKDLVLDIINVRPLEIYTGHELTFTRGFIYVIAIILLASYYFKIRNRSEKVNSNAIFFLVASIVMMVCYFVVPDSASVGMMTMRFGFYLFLFFLIWLSLQKNFRLVAWIMPLIIYYLHFSLLIQMHKPVIDNLNQEALEVIDAGKHVVPNSVVLPVDCTDNWLMGNFIDYAALDKPIINPRNYEANVKWFPVLWNNSSISHDSFETYSFDLTNEPGRHRKIDYIFVLGDFSKITSGQFPKVQQMINKAGKLEFATDDGRIHLFSINHNL